MIPAAVYNRMTRQEQLNVFADLCPHNEVPPDCPEGMGICQVGDLGTMRFIGEVGWQPRSDPNPRKWTPALVIFAGPCRAYELHEDEGG